MAHAQTQHIQTFAVTPAVKQQRERDGEQYQRRREIDQRHADMRLKRELKEVWE